MIRTRPRPGRIELDLVVPGDPASFPTKGRSFPALRRLMARGEREDGPDGIEPLLFHLFGVPTGADDPPVAPFCRLADSGQADAEWWIRADPVHLMPGRDRLYLAVYPLELPPEQARQLLSDVNSLLQDEGLVAQFHDPARWYLRLEGKPAIRTAPPLDVLGKPIDKGLPSGPDASKWRSRLNAIQMVLHESGVNQRRQDEGLPTANSLWFWGVGRLSSLRQRVWAGVWADDCLTRGISMCGGIQPRTLPASARQWHQEWAANPEPGRALLVLPAMGEGLWAVLEREWLGPLLDLLKRREVDTVRVLFSAGEWWRLDRSSLRRWWRHRDGFFGS